MSNGLNGDELLEQHKLLRKAIASFLGFIGLEDDPTKLNDAAIGVSFVASGQDRIVMLGLIDALAKTQAEPKLVDPFLTAKLLSIKIALHQVDQALKNREHGGIAAMRFVDACREILEDA